MVGNYWGGGGECGRQLLGGECGRQLLGERSVVGNYCGRGVW